MKQNKELGVRIYREWYELTKPLMDRDGDKWWRLFDGVMAYALGRNTQPDFSDDAELQELFEKTNLRPCDYSAGKEGWLKVRKRKGGHNYGRD